MDRHLLFDGALHAHQANTELVLEQLAHRTHAAVAEVVDVIHAADVAMQPQQVADHSIEVVGGERLLLHGTSVSSLMLNLKRPTREKS